MKTKRIKKTKSDEFGRIQLPKGKTANDRAKENVEYPSEAQPIASLDNPELKKQARKLLAKHGV
jgi:hypothetical protein